MMYVPSAVFLYIFQFLLVMAIMSVNLLNCCKGRKKDKAVNTGSNPNNGQGEKTIQKEKTISKIKPGSTQMSAPSQTATKSKFSYSADGGKTDLTQQTEDIQNTQLTVDEQKTQLTVTNA